MKLVGSALIIVLIACSSLAQPNYQPSKENLQNREWFQNAKFGLFVHWGVYSVLAGGGENGIAEWIMNKKQIPISQYEKVPAFFNPIEFDPAEWVATVKKAGMKYITITSKHHDGFAMYDSKVSDYNVVKKTPYGKDILQQLKAECDKQGIKLFFYYSQLDWHHPDYFPRGKTGQKFTGRSESGNWDNYIDYMNAQLTELLTGYGEIGGIWFDGMWDKKEAPWQLEKTYKLIHELQPGALIGSNHHLAPISGEDFQMFERDLPGENTMGFNQTGSISTLPLEMCETMNGSWGFNLIDSKYKTSKQLIQTMVKAAGFGANFLLNTGPMPNGKIQPENVDTLLKMGEWLNQYGESIYDTRKGPVLPAEWGATTQKGNIVYIHILKLNGDRLVIPHWNLMVKSIRSFDGEEKIRYRKANKSLTIVIPDELRNDVNTILKMELK